MALNFCRDQAALLSSNDNSGSLVRYDPSTNQTTVLLRGLALAAGVAVSRDGSFVLVSEFLLNRIQRFWLKGPRANTSEIFLLLAGRPDNIKRNRQGQFWVAVNSYLGPPPPPTPPIWPRGIRVNEFGVVLQFVSLAEEYGTEPVSEVREFNGTLYAGSLRDSYVSVFTP